MTTPAKPTAETAVAIRQNEPTLTPFQVIERVITQGDLGKMTAEERVAFYWRTCESLGLNPLTRPFEFINLNGKLVMYARKDATDQLRRINAVSVTSIDRDRDDDLGILTVTVSGRDRSGREDQATGVVNIKGLSGEALANAVMKAETKAKRRMTLSLVGLGFLDESEVEGAPADVDPTTGELVERPKPKSLLDTVRAQTEAMTAQDAPGRPAQAEVDADTPDAAPDASGAADDAVDGESREVLTRDELLAELEKLNISPAYAGEVSKATFGGGQLTDAQRGELLAKLRAETTDQPDLAL
jgi:hypothetical protein